MNQPHEQTDVVIVGGGPAGLSAAIACALNHIKCVVLEAKTYPIDKPCGEGIMPEGTALLHTLGVMPHIASDQMKPFYGVRFINDAGAMASNSFAGTNGLGLRRTALSQALYDRACELNEITVRTNTRVTNIRKENNRMMITTDKHDAIACKLVVGADGLRSRVRKWVGLDESADQSIRRYGMRKHFLLPPWSDRVLIYFKPGAEAYITPAGSDQTNVAFLWDKKILRPHLKRISFDALLDYFPKVKQQIINAQPIPNESAVGPLKKNCVSPIADGVALIGDASGYSDAITGEGNSIAMAQSLALAAVVKAALAKHQHALVLKQSLRSYAKQHRQIVRSYYRNTQMLLALARRPRLMNHLINFFSDHEKFFSWLINQARER